MTDTLTHTITLTHQTSGGSISQGINVTGTGEQRVIEAFASDASDVQIVVSIPDGEVKAVTILSTAACTLAYNDSSGTQGSITLAANKPLMWYEGAEWDLADVMGYVGAALDVTSLYLTADGAAGVLTILVLTDATPA